MLFRSVYENVLKWSKIYDASFYNLLIKDKQFSLKVFNIERDQKKPRKDFGSWSEVKENIWYMFDELFKEIKPDFSEVNNAEKYREIINLYLSKYYDINDDKQSWFNKIKELCEELGYATDMKEYKSNPENYNGSVADVSNILRVAITSKSTTPDLYIIMQIIGNDSVTERLSKLLI